MTNRVLSILDLNDIVEPDAVGAWPLAPALTAFLVLVLAGVLGVVILTALRWHSAAYRREALRLLSEASTPGEIMVLLKRVALAGWPRETVAPLHGDEWINFLNDCCPRSSFKADAELAALSAQAALWIQHHRRPDSC
ncbi:DUF4381 domain-containing protein [Pontiella sulfatireligans]|uniref:DUF4381 domain-containing protein n=1 Tax=Pontiella sulfatireligans TaxID=2750658 RepID=A0A6C2UE25_9BACT|nr:DUF4381 domain-containing protein [Pontiella sulfatireligans]VGO18420.1 hypothetical protein SCARR_00473 [Pontiella sulfatireligans]